MSQAINTFTETHCHLDYLKQDSLDGIITKCNEAGVNKIITISVEPDNLDSVLTIANLHPQIYCTQGIHPHNASEYNQTVLEKIKKNAQANSKKVVAIGEIGLDYHYNKSPIEQQKAAFEEQLQLACDLDLPVVIHTRDADEDTQFILKKFSSKLKRKGVLHSFTSSLDLAMFAIGEGFSLGFNGIITFKNAQNVRDVLQACPLDKILVETDAPFLTPIPHRGKENAPFYIPFIAQKIAEIKMCDIETIAQATNQNANNLFRFKL